MRTMSKISRTGDTVRGESTTRRWCSNFTVLCSWFVFSSGFVRYRVQGTCQRPPCVPTRTPNGEPRTANRELNTNQEQRTQKCEPLLWHRNLQRHNDASPVQHELGPAPVDDGKVERQCLHMGTAPRRHGEPQRVLPFTVGRHT